MIRQTINLNEHTFICDFYNNSEFSTSNETKFVMLRNLTVDRSIITDSDVYIIEKDLLNFNGNNIDLYSQDNIVFPITGEVQRFSTNIKNFVKLTEPKIYNLYKRKNISVGSSSDVSYTESNINTGVETNDFDEATIKYDTIRIYHPTTKVNNINCIIHIENYINSIHFHYFCRLYSDLTPLVETEFSINNNVYSEYVEFKVPNIKDLISKDVFFIEDATFLKINESAYPGLIYNTNTDDVFCSTYLFSIPYIIEINENTVQKVFLPEIVKTLETNYSVFPINITLYPFGTVEKDIYTPDDILVPNTDVFVEAPKISTAVSLGFNDETGKLKIKLKFNYPESDKFETVQEAYEFYNNTKVSDHDENNKIGIDFDEDSEVDDDYPFAYILEISADSSFKDLIYKSDFTPEDALEMTVFNKEFDIPVFDDWKQLPDVLLCRVRFLDKYLGVSLLSNMCIISKEYYKYIVKNDYTEQNIFRLELNNNTDMQFLDKVTCVVKKETPQTDNADLQINGVSKVFFKPIFFKVQDLQSIKIQSGVVQNIGINLSNYMTKVETFFLTIDNNRFIETGRNDVYVIFSIIANQIKNNSGYYHISNQDDEYISSGQWSLIK